ncbi:MAG: hypothetical protein K8R16_05995 [Anaerolineales bacterium]|nr:hypothetical protein [Anaerolineales bacterium]
MYFKSIEDKRIIPILSQWLDEDGETFIDVYIPLSGGGTTRRLIGTIDSFKEDIAGLPSGASIELIQANLYPFEGIIDDKFVRRVISNTIDGQWYEIHILDTDEYGRCSPEEIGSRLEMKAYLEENLGARVRLGPFVHIPEGIEDIKTRVDLISAKKQ